jgi:hypothetical protein
MGMWAAIYPYHCLRILNIKTINEYKCSIKQLKNEGHHPNCGEFSKHTIYFRNKKYCVGCAGLLVGGFLAIITILMYLIYGTSEIILWIGFIITLTSLFQLTLLNLENKVIKFFSNLVLVLGSALIFTGIINYSNIFSSLYLLFLMIAWIFTRTVVSENNHHLICKDCVRLSNKKGGK